VPGDPDRDGLHGVSDPCALEARNQCAGPVALDSTTGSPLRINSHPAGGACGGIKIDCMGDAWTTDSGRGGEEAGLTCEAEDGADQCTIAGVEEMFGCTSAMTEDLLRCQRGGVGAFGAQLYRFDVPDGAYVVNLLFARIDGDDTVESSVDVVIEGDGVATALDVLGESGGLARALVRSFVVDVSDGDGLQIAALPLGGYAALGAVEVLTLQP
jgi:hypothetical protein